MTIKVDWAWWTLDSRHASHVQTHSCKAGLPIDAEFGHKKICASFFAAFIGKLLFTHPSAQSLAPEMARLTSAIPHCSLSTSHAMTGPETRRASDIPFGTLYTACLFQPVSPKVCIYTGCVAATSLSRSALGVGQLAPVVLEVLQHLLAMCCNVA